MDYEKIKEQPDVQEYHLPDGSTILLREQNGEDEAVLSNEKDTVNGKAIRKFLARIIMGIKKVDSEVYEPCTTNMVAGMKSRNVYYALLLSRIHSLGAELVVTKKFKDPANPATSREVQLEIDLSEYQRNFDGTVEYPMPGDEDYDKHQCLPYPRGAEDYVVTKLTSGREIRFRYLTNRAEFDALASIQAMDINTTLLLREFEYKKDDNNWMSTKTFKEFTSREMREIRGLASKHDPEFTILAQAENPYNGEPEEFTLIGEPDFFFPVD